MDLITQWALRGANGIALMLVYLQHLVTLFARKPT